MESHPTAIGEKLKHLRSDLQVIFTRLWRKREIKKWYISDMEVHQIACVNANAGGEVQASKVAITNDVQSIGSLRQAWDCTDAGLCDSHKISTYLDLTLEFDL